MDGDSDSERVMSRLVNGPVSLLRYEDDDADDDDDINEEDDTEDDDYEFQDDYVYDIASRLKEVNTMHFAEPNPVAREHKVRFADNPVDRVMSYSPTPLMDVDERLQLKRDYLSKLFARDDSERGGDDDSGSELFSSSDEDDEFIDHAATSPSVEFPRTPSPAEHHEIVSKTHELLITEVTTDQTETEHQTDEQPDTPEPTEPNLNLQELDQPLEKNLVISEPHPPAVTLNGGTENLANAEFSKERVKTPTDLPLIPKSPSRPPFSVSRKTSDRLSTTEKFKSFPPSPTRFIRKSTATSQIKPQTSSNSSETSSTTEVKKLPTYTGNERSRYGLPKEEKAKLKEERERIKKEKEQKAQQDEEAKLQRKLDAQKTFEAWLKNKELNKKNPLRRKILDANNDTSNKNQLDSSSSSSATFMTWLERKKIQAKHEKLQLKLKQIELEELEHKHTRQDAQHAYKRWLRKKALETEQQRVLHRQQVVERKLNAVSMNTKETIERFFESSQFHTSLRPQPLNGKA